MFYFIGDNYQANNCEYLAGAEPLNKESSPPD